MSFAGLLLFASVYFVAVSSPGPGIALAIARGMGRGRDRLGWFILGFALGDVVMFLIAASGLAIIAQTFETAFALIRYAGASYLAYVAYKIWTAPVGALQIVEAAGRESAAAAFLSSFLLTLGNPKVIVFFMSIMPLVVDMRNLTLLLVIELTVVILAVIIPVLGGVALAAERARRLFSSERAMRTMNRTTAGVMAGVAVAIAAR